MAVERKQPHAVRTDAAKAVLYSSYGEWPIKVIRWTLVTAFSILFLLPVSYSFQVEYGRADADAQVDALYLKGVAKQRRRQKTPPRGHSCAAEGDLLEIVAIVGDWIVCCSAIYVPLSSIGVAVSLRRRTCPLSSINFDQKFENFRPVLSIPSHFSFF